jgi:thiol-disulfide isomerase/thioredoxin
VIVALLLTAVACSRPAPTVRDTEGNAVTRVSTQGKWVIVNYWATWCDSCIQEIPELDQFNATRPANVLLYGVNFDQLALPALKTAMAVAKITFPVLTADPSMLWQLSDVTVLPTTFIINPQGKIVRKILGVSTQASLAAALKEAEALQSP